MRPPLVKGNDPLTAVFSSALASGAIGLASGPDFVSGPDAGHCPAPNTYRGSRPVLDRPPEPGLRDLETHSFPRAGPVKGLAERAKALSSYTPGSGEGQDRVDHPPTRRVFSRSRATIQSSARAARSSAECRLRGLGHRHLGDYIGTTPAHSVAAPVRRWAWPPPPISRPGTSAYRTPSAAGACSRLPGRVCGPGWTGPWTFRASSRDAACTSVPPGWPGGRGPRLRRTPI
jgi:hypothetical protein